MHYIEYHLVVTVSSCCRWKVYIAAVFNNSVEYHLLVMWIVVHCVDVVIKYRVVQ